MNRPPLSQGAPDGPTRSSPSRGVVVPHRPKWFQRLGATVLYFLERILSATWRFQWEDRSRLLKGTPAQPIIFCLWHNRLATAMTIQRHTRLYQPERRLAALVSASKDGAFLACVLARFGIEAVRGSTSRRGPQALLELTTTAERGYDLAITPDGPRGPCYIVQPGVIAVAQLTGLPIVPVAYRASWTIRLKSWDRFIIPLPFSRCEVVFDTPLRVPREATDAERDQVRRELERRLRALASD